MARRRPTAAEWEGTLGSGPRRPEKRNEQKQDPPNSGAGGIVAKLAKLTIGTVATLVVLTGIAYACQWDTSSETLEGLTAADESTAQIDDRPHNTPVDRPPSTPSDRLRREAPGEAAPTGLEKQENAAWLKQRHGSTYRKLENLAWIKDGLTGPEADVAQDLMHMAANDIATLQAVLVLDWTKEAISEAEAKAIESLMYMSYRNGETSKEVAGMQFLSSVTEEDALLIAGMRGKAHRGTLQTFMQHPSINDGIEETEVIKAVAATTTDNAEQLNKILTPGRATVETIQTSSSRTPDLRISIVRAGDRRATDTSVVVERAVEHVEEFMGLPLPTNHVILLLDDTAVTPGFAGVNYGQAIAYLRKGEDGTDWEKAGFRTGMVHEVAHYFWRGSEDWIDEGVANTIERVYADANTIPPEITDTKRNGCTATHLKALAAMSPQQQSTQFMCNYYLGEKLFLELRQTLGQQEFSQRLRGLYDLVLTANEEAEKAGIEEVRTIFHSETPIVDRHWDNTVTADAKPTTRPPSEEAREPAQLYGQHELETREAKELGFRLTVPKAWKPASGINSIGLNTEIGGMWLQVEATILTQGTTPEQHWRLYEEHEYHQRLARWHTVTRSAVTLTKKGTIEEQVSFKRCDQCPREVMVTHRRDGITTDGRPIAYLIWVHYPETADMFQKVRQVMDSFEAMPATITAAPPTLEAMPSAPQLTPQPSPTATRRPTIEPTRTPHPTATPKPTRTPTQTPPPTPTPTPTPTPAPTPQASLTLEGDKYAINYGHVWHVADIYSASNSPFYNVRVAHSEESYLGDFYFQYFTEHLDRIRNDFYESGRTYPIYEPIDSAGKGYHIHREYRWQTNEAQCLYRVIEHYRRSQYPDADYGFIFTTGVCEDDPNRQGYETEREIMLKSFREK